MGKKTTQIIDHKSGKAREKTVTDYGRGYKKIEIVEVNSDGLFGTRFLGSRKPIKSISITPRR
jgi:hypothetical protein